MPLYEFDCLDCGESFEKLVRSVSAINQVVCPTCGQPHVQKKLSMFASGGSKSGSTSVSSSAASSCSTGGT
jgi:putative FmdB family regulatory protein